MARSTGRGSFEMRRDLVNKGRSKRENRSSKKISLAHISCFPTDSIIKFLSLSFSLFLPFSLICESNISTWTRGDWRGDLSAFTGSQDLPSLTPTMAYFKLFPLSSLLSSELLLSILPFSYQFSVQSLQSSNPSLPPSIASRG